MASNRDTVLTDYVRMKIAEWQASGREQQELAEIAKQVAPGFGKSTVAQVKRSTGVGAKTAPGFAHAFGFPSVQAMVDAAYEWRKSSGSALEELLTEPEVQEAIQLVKDNTPGATDESLRAILAGFTHPMFRGRERMYWWETLTKEAQRDRDAAIRHKIDLQTTRAVRAADAKKIQQAFREAAPVKKKLDEINAEAERQAAEKAAKKSRSRKRQTG